MTGSVRLEVGSVFAGDYKVLRPLAEGAERAVYAAEQVSTGREIALKVISPALVPDDASKAAFAAEVRVGGKIQTEHLVDVRAAGIDATTGFPWLAMELLEGEDLAKTLADHGKPDLPDWDEVLSQTCRGMAAVHAAGVAHGALMPETIFLAVPGSNGERFRVELLDLGIPHVARDAAKGDGHRVAWLAPEQLDGGKPTPASDVWTIGMLAFRMVVGKHYLAGANGPSADAESLKKEIASGTREAASARAKALGSTARVSPAFDAWFAKATALAPADRWPDAGVALEGAADLLGEASGIDSDVEEDREGPRVKPPPLPPMVAAIAQNPKPAIIAIVVLVAVALAGGFGLGAILKPGKQRDARAKANVWARGEKADTERACNAGDAVACHGLGLMYLYGLKVSRDEAMAAKQFQRACDGGDIPACGSLAARYLNGEGVAEDKKKAAELYRGACDQRDMVSCIDLAEMYENGNGVAKDEAQAQALKDKACREGFSEVCRLPTRTRASRNRRSSRRSRPMARRVHPSPAVKSKPAPVQPGDVLADKYRVDEVLGEGGMGIVVAATHLALGQRVALKFLLPDAAKQPDTIARFLREARAAVRVKGEHVAKVSDVATLENGLPYMVMEYLEGVDLGALLDAEGAVGVVESVDYVLQACEAVAEAHRVGVVHRDLKPSNLFLTKRADGSPCIKVLDFGISKVMGPHTSGSMGVTKTKEVVGSPFYMSPEQMRSSKDVDGRADIWSLGVILYELLTNDLAFKGDNVTAVCASVLQDPTPRVRAKRPDVPEALEAVVLRCLEKEPEARYADVAELAMALAPFASDDGRTSADRVVRIVRGTTGSQVAAQTATAAPHSTSDVAWGATDRPPPPRKTNVWTYAVVAGAALAVGAYAAERLVPPRRSVPVVAAAATPIPGQAPAVPASDPPPPANVPPRADAPAPKPSTTAEPQRHTTNADREPSSSARRATPRPAPPPVYVARPAQQPTSQPTHPQQGTVTAPPPGGATPSPRPAPLPVDVFAERK